MKLIVDDSVGSPQKEYEENTWEEVHEEYSRDQYPIFGGPFTDNLTPWEWLEMYYNPPTIKTPIN